MDLFFLVRYHFPMSITAKADILGRHVVLAAAPGDTVLRDEREKRRMSREELAEAAKISVPWLRQLEMGKELPGPDARVRLRAALEICPIHRDFKIACNHKLPVPPDDQLYSRR